jgi:hypothetical protein
MAVAIAGEIAADSGVEQRKRELFAYLDERLDTAGLVGEIAATRAPSKMPRHIWMYWHDGWDNAPEVAKLCLRSWKLHNPDFELHALDFESLPQFVSDVPVHKGASKLNGFANRVRLRLLRNHGGVWADATLFCTQPVDPWISEMVAAAQFFALVSPEPDRIVATWFIAATAQSPLIVAWERMLAAYFECVENDNRPIHAYFVMAYILEYLLGKHPQLQALWEQMPKVRLQRRAKVSSIAQLTRTGDVPAIDAATRKAIANALTRNNMQKLTWKAGMLEGTAPARQVLEMLDAHLQAHGEHHLRDTTLRLAVVPAGISIG